MQVLNSYYYFVEIFITGASSYDILSIARFL